MIVAGILIVAAIGTFGFIVAAAIWPDLLDPECWNQSNEPEEEIADTWEEES